MGRKGLPSSLHPAAGLHHWVGDVVIGCRGGGTWKGQGPHSQEAFLPPHSFEMIIQTMIPSVVLLVTIITLATGPGM